MKTFNSLAASLAAMALLGACGGSPAPSPVAGQPPVALADTVFSPPVPPVAPPDLPPLTRPAAVAHMALPSEERGPCLAGGTIRTVYPTMTVADIQALVASAANGDTILFKPGTYSMLSFEVRRRLQIIAEVPGETLLVGTTRPSTGWHDARNEKTDPKDTAQLHGAGILFRGIWPGGNSADGSCVSGLSMRFHEQAIRVEHAENILFENNRYESAFGDGLVLKDTKNMVVRNNQFLDPYLGVDDPGTLAAGFPDHRFDAQMDYGISVYGSINPRIHHNYFYGFFNQTVSFKNGNVDAYAADNTFEGSRLTALLFGQEPAASASDPADALTYQRYQSFTRDRGAMRAYNNVFRPVKTVFRGVAAEYPLHIAVRVGWVEPTSSVDIAGNVIEGATAAVHIGCMVKKAGGVVVAATCPANTIGIHENVMNGTVTDAAGLPYVAGSWCAVQFYREAVDAPQLFITANVTIDHATIANYPTAVCTTGAPVTMKNSLLYASAPIAGYNVISGGASYLGYLTFFNSGTPQGEASRTDNPALVGNVDYKLRTAAIDTGATATANQSPLACGFKPGAYSTLQGTGMAGTYRGAFAPDVNEPLTGALVSVHEIGPARHCAPVQPAPPGTY
jgi:hypothetical protein